MSLPGIGSTGALQEQPPEISFVGAVNLAHEIMEDQVIILCAANRRCDMRRPTADYPSRSSE